MTVNLSGLNVSAEIGENYFDLFILAFVSVLALLKNGRSFPIKSQFILIKTGLIVNSFWSV